MYYYATSWLPALEGAWGRRGMLKLDRCSKVGAALIEVFHEDHFILLLVVEEFVYLRLHEDEPKSARAQPLLLSDGAVLGWFLTVCNSGVVEVGEFEPRTGIGDPIE